MSQLQTVTSSTFVFYVWCSYTFLSIFVCMCCRTLWHS